ncbi:Rieske 2Fe-2S domain-containing protein [Patulibacter defluvii]|uniref:Rieske 2Fe-2S domain-containing protein n=1 Tax=Patulibacter defluvii TaxID=3095358 RepID=UPI002A75D1FA|nr:Rieske 2Fe-2S domain-containing protein [Patulibacter sp. DM4]
MGDAGDEQLPTDEEVERALRRAWFPVARIADLERPRRVELLGETLVAYLDEGGTPQVVADRCGHRGASLADGHVEGDRIVCPYHGWQWRGGDGRCVHIPSLGPEAVIPPRALIARHHAREQWGLVWCCLDEPAVPLPWPDALDGSGWIHGPGRPIAIAAGPRAATENFRDVAHFPFVHAGTMGHLDAVVAPLAVERDGTEVRMSRTYDARGGQDALWQERMTFGYHAIAPAFVCLRMEHEDGAVRFLLNAPSPHTAPTAPGRPRSTIFWVEGFTPDYRAMTLDEVLESEAQVYDEDSPILDRLEPGEATLDNGAEVHTPADRYTLAYRQAFRAFVRLANGAPAAETAASAAAD